MNRIYRCWKRHKFWSVGFFVFCFQIASDPVTAFLRSLPAVSTCIWLHAHCMPRWILAAQSGTYALYGIVCTAACSQEYVDRIVRIADTAALPQARCRAWIVIPLSFRDCFVRRATRAPSPLYHRNLPHLRECNVTRGLMTSKSVHRLVCTVHPVTLARVL